MQLKKFRKQLQKSITSNNLPQIHRHIINAQIYSIDSIQWRKYLVQIFVMLTNSEIQIPTFIRRTHVFSIFKIAIQDKIMQNKDGGASIRRNVHFLKRVIQAIIMATTSRRNTDTDMEISFHKFVQKILITLSSQLQEVSKQSLAQDKLKILGQAYPIPNLKNASSTTTQIAVEFIYPDLLLWYQLCFHIQKSLQFRYLGQQELSEYLSKLRSQVENIRQPVLKLIFLYTLAQQAIKIKSLFQQSQRISQKCIKIGLLIMTEIRENVAIVFNIKQTGTAYQQLAQNVFHCMIRFNVILLTFTLLQKISNSIHTNLIESLIKQIKNCLTLSLPHCQKMISQTFQHEDDQKINLLYQKYFKYELQFYWIDYHLDKLYVLVQNKNNYNYRNREGEFIQDGMFMNWNKISFLLNEDDRNQEYKYQNFQKFLEKQIKRYREKRVVKFSEGVKMSKLVSWSFFLLENNPHLFQQIITKIMVPLEIVRFVLALLTQYHMNYNILIHISLHFAQQVLLQFLTCAQSIKQTQQIQSIKHSIYILRLSIVNKNNYVCSLCSVLQIYQFCQYCGQACSKFIYPQQLQLNIKQKWEEWIKIMDYFVNNQKNRLRQAIGGQLIQQLRLATYVDN